MRRGEGAPRDARVERPRAAWQVRANAVVIGYLILSVVALAGVIIGGGRETPRWLAVHLLLLGGATNAIVIWGEHFASALLRSPVPDRRRSAVRLAVLNACIVAVLAGVAFALPVVTVSGAGTLALVIVLHVVGLVGTARKSLQGRFAGTVDYYVAAGIALLAGIVLGVLLAVHAVDEGRAEALRAAHVHANILGWISLTVLGTLFTLWPTVLRTRMVDGVMRAASKGPMVLCTGLALAVLGFTACVVEPGPTGLGPHAAGRWTAGAGLATYAIGVGVAMRPFVATWRRKAPHDAASWSLAAATAWLVLGLLADLALVATAPDLEAYDHALDALVPLLLVGFVAQVLLGALTFLLPVVIGGGPSRVRASIGRLSLAWPVRVVAMNAGVGLIALGSVGLPGPAGLVCGTGWLLVASAFAAALALFISLLAGPKPRRGS
jgi:nitrite reductase (NO-forming)